MSNFYEIIQECRLELNYKPASTFAGLTKNDDLKLMNVINRVNKTIVLSDSYWFRQKKTTLNADTSIEYTLLFNGQIIDIMQGTEHYYYEPDYTKFYDGTVGSQRYGFYSGKLLLPSYSTTTTITIYYITNNPAADSTGVTEKNMMELETDISIIPELYRNNILVYGSCAAFKAMPSNDKYKHWTVQYNIALAKMRSNCLNSIGQMPHIPMLENRPTVSPDSFRHIL